ncbi:hypothetical protein CFIMG_008308RA00001 [Ceratocystis fimbriata CBS 114723]|uniref:Uncharacterized protein n=1 Tax=Ceratocystis fimbriata CBS 114723 TaxID=1035309 RepID=A0A2C5X4S5_9PEZI|nr:hypothetical protein CFIMG_008308RA00001 [Ceratocystis fimbriata CBS 114723]
MTRNTHSSLLYSDLGFMIGQKKHRTAAAASNRTVDAQLNGKRGPKKAAVLNGRLGISHHNVCTKLPPSLAPVRVSEWATVSRYLGGLSYFLCTMICLGLEGLRYVSKKDKSISSNGPEDSELLLALF